jgi:transaldolase
MYISRMIKELSLPKIKIYLDSASSEEITEYYLNHRDYISGFTTNPTLMKNAGVKDYLTFVNSITKEINDLPISFEVFANDLDEMKRQALQLAEISSNVCVKIPVTNTKGISTHNLVSDLNKNGVFCNVTAIMTFDQITKIKNSLNSDNRIIFSIFAGRIADTGRDPSPILTEICDSLKSLDHISVLWASTRELLNVFQAQASGCHIVTVTSALLRKIENIGKNLDELSLETVQMFFDDAKSAGYRF